MAHRFHGVAGHGGSMITTKERRQELLRVRHMCGCELCLSGLSYRAWRCLHESNYRTIAQVSTGFRRNRVNRHTIPGFGPKCVGEARRMVRLAGLWTGYQLKNAPSYRMAGA